MSDAFETPRAGDISQALRRAASRYAAGCAVIDGDHRLTWRELDAQVDHTARSLISAGVDHGDVVAIWAPNSAPWVIAALAIYRVGARLLPINTRFKPSEAAFVLNRARAKLLFTAETFLGRSYAQMLRDAGVALPHLQQTISWRLKRDGLAGFQQAGAGLAHDAVARAERQISPHDVSDIVFTSGTTGAPKGAMLTHRSSLSAIEGWNARLQITHADRYLIVNPFFHTFGLKGGILSCVLAGATMIPQAVFEPATALATIARAKVSIFPGPPTIYQMLLDHPELAGTDTRSLRVAVTGAAAIPVELLARMRREMSFRSILTAYGLTEATGLVTMSEVSDDFVSTSTTAGRVLPGMEVRIVDDHGQAVASGEPGEILARGPNLMRGYLHDPAATAEAIDGDGFLHTGDIGVLRPDGRLSITDRKKDMFIVGGFNAYPAEIENILARHEAVSQAAVIGVPDPRLGEVGVAFVILRPGYVASPEDLTAWSADEMANYKVPRRVVVLDEFPMNSTGKIQKSALRELISVEPNPDIAKRGNEWVS